MLYLSATSLSHTQYCVCEESLYVGTNNNNNNNDNNKNDRKETVMLKWIQIGGKPQNNDAVVKAMNDYSIEKIGIGVDITYLDWSVWSDKVTAMINSGEYWDMMFTNGDKLIPSEAIESAY